MILNACSNRIHFSRSINDKIILAPINASLQDKQNAYIVLMLCVRRAGYRRDMLTVCELQLQMLQRIVIYTLLMSFTTSSTTVHSPLQGNLVTHHILSSTNVDFFIKKVEDQNLRDRNPSLPFTNLIGQQLSRDPFTMN